MGSFGMRGARFGWTVGMNTAGGDDSGPIRRGHHQAGPGPASIESTGDDTSRAWWMANRRGGAGANTARQCHQTAATSMGKGPESGGKGGGLAEGRASGTAVRKAGFTPIDRRSRSV